MIVKRVLRLASVLALGACGGYPPSEPPRTPTEVSSTGGDGQSAAVNSVLTDPLSVQVTDENGDPVSDVTVTWSVLTGDGAISLSSSTTDVNGTARAVFTLGATLGQQRVQAVVNGVAGSPVIFTATAIATGRGVELRVLGGGHNVPERFSSDLWVHGTYAYTGTWGRRAEVGNVLKVWSLAASGAPTQVGSVTVTTEIGTVSDVEVSADGQVLALSGERGTNGGIYLYDLSDPATPTLVGSAEVGKAGVHTVTLATINGRRYAFAARNPGLAGNPEEDPALLIYDVTDPRAPAPVARQTVPRNYGIHDIFVRDGVAFVFAWNTGVIIYDVGNGVRGGSPDRPVQVSRLVTSANGVAGGPAVHNGWWFHNPVTGERRYLFVGQEGAGVVGSRSSGDIHVVDISDLAQAREVAFFHLDGAGTHNFWMDEQRQILYAAYYNGGVVALDVSGTLAGNLSGRLLAQTRPGGEGNTFTWGVQLANGFLYAIDMLSGLWQLRMD